MKREKVEFVSKDGYKVTCYFPISWKKPIGEHAKNRDRSVTSFIRQIVREYLKL